VQDFFQKSLSKATFERKLSSVSLPLATDVSFSLLSLFCKKWASLSIILYNR